MKRLSLLAFVLALCSSAFAIDVYIDLKDATLNAAPYYTNRSLKIYALSTPTIGGPSVIMGQPLMRTTDSNGIAWMSNSVYNLYWVQVLSPPKLEEFKYWLNPSNSTPVMGANTNLVADATATFPGGSIAYAAAVTDERYQQRFPDGSSFVPNFGAVMTNVDIRWQLGAAGQWIRLYRPTVNSVYFEYQSGAIQVMWHTFDNLLHYDTSPTFDYATTYSLPIFDGLGHLVSLDNGSVPGVLTNDSNGNLGWYPGSFVSTDSGSATNISIYHNDPLGNLMMFNGNETWSTNASAVVPVTRVLGGISAPGFAVNGQLNAAKPINSSQVPFVVDGGGNFPSDISLWRSNGVVLAKINDHGIFSAKITSTNLINYGNPIQSPGAGNGSEAFGFNATASGNSATAFGDNSQATANFATAFGTAASATFANSSAFGDAAFALTIDSGAFGYNANAVHDESTVVGANSASTMPGQVTLGSSAVTNITIGSAVYIFRGSGNPNNNVTAPVGSLYLNQSGGSGTTLYVKESGSGNTGWIGK
jgi:hypothetical protein